MESLIEAVAASAFLILWVQVTILIMRKAREALRQDYQTDWDDDLENEWELYYESDPKNLPSDEEWKQYLKTIAEGK